MTGWEQDAYAVLCDLARSDKAFTVEDIRYIAGDPGPDDDIHRVISKARENKLITRVGDRVARRPEAQGRRISKWQGTKQGALL